MKRVCAVPWASKAAAGIFDDDADDDDAGFGGVPGAQATMDQSRRAAAGLPDSDDADFQESRRRRRRNKKRGGGAQYQSQIPWCVPGRKGDAGVAPGTHRVMTPRLRNLLDELELEKDAVEAEQMAGD